MSRLKEFNEINRQTDMIIKQMPGNGNADTYSILSFPFIVDMAKSLAVIADSLQMPFTPSEDSPEMKCEDD